MINVWKTIGDKLKADLTEEIKRVRKTLESKIGTVYIVDTRELKLVALSLFSSGASLVQILKDKKDASKAARLTEDKLLEYIHLVAAKEANAAAGTLRAMKISGAGIIGGATNRYDHIKNLIEVFRSEGKITDKTYILIDHTQIQRIQRKLQK